MNELTPMSSLTREATSRAGTEPDVFRLGDSIGHTFPEPTVQLNGDSTAGGNESPAIGDTSSELDAVTDDVPPVGPPSYP